MSPQISLEPKVGGTGHHSLRHPVPERHNRMKIAGAILSSTDPLLKKWPAVGMNPGQSRVWLKHSGGNQRCITQNTIAYTQSLKRSHAISGLHRTGNLSTIIVA